MTSPPCPAPDDACAPDIVVARAGQWARAYLARTRNVAAVGAEVREAAHKFNNLLTVVQSSVELLQMPNLAAERHARYLRAIEDATDRAAGLVRQLQILAHGAAPKRIVLDVQDRLGVPAPDSGPTCTNVDAAGFDAAIKTLAGVFTETGASDHAPKITVAAVAGQPAWGDQPAVAGAHVVITLSEAHAGDVMSRRVMAAVEPVDQMTPAWLELFAFLARNTGSLQISLSPDGVAAIALSLPAVAAENTPDQSA